MGRAKNHRKPARHSNLDRHQDDPYGPDPDEYVAYAYGSTDSNQAIVQGGDSGSPTFITVNGQTVPGRCRLLYTPTLWQSFRQRRLLHALVAAQLDADMGQAASCPTSTRRSPPPGPAAAAAVGPSGGNWSSGVVPADGCLQRIGDDLRLGPLLNSRGSLATYHCPGRQPDRHLHHLQQQRTGRQPLHDSTGSSNDLLTIGEAGISNQDAVAQNIDCSGRPEDLAALGRRRRRAQRQRPDQPG